MEARLERLGRVGLAGGKGREIFPQLGKPGRGFAKVFSTELFEKVVDVGGHEAR
jgi:hypothetical protein